MNVSPSRRTHPSLAPRVRPIVNRDLPNFICSLLTTSWMLTFLRIFLHINKRIEERIVTKNAMDVNFFGVSACPRGTLRIILLDPAATSFPPDVPIFHEM